MKFAQDLYEMLGQKIYKLHEQQMKDVKSKGVKNMNKYAKNYTLKTFMKNEYDILGIIKGNLMLKIGKVIEPFDIKNYIKYEDYLVKDIDCNVYYDGLVIHIVKGN